MKHYYDCPIKAAYQAKYFGMNFKSPRGQNLHFDGGRDFCTEKDCGIYSGERHYIHPDSLEVLEPMMDDVIEDGDGDYQEINYDHELFIIRHGFRKIIQRDSLPFLWPETEE